MSGDGEGDAMRGGKEWEGPIVHLILYLNPISLIRPALKQFCFRSTSGMRSVDSPTHSQLHRQKMWEADIEDLIFHIFE